MNAPGVGMCHTKFGCIRRTFLLPSKLYATIYWHLLFNRVSHWNEGGLTLHAHQWQKARDLPMAFAVDFHFTLIEALQTGPGSLYYNTMFDQGVGTNLVP
jgi:hypothetical protein